MKLKIVLYNPKESTRVRVPHVPFSILTVGSALKDRYDIVIVDGRLDAQSKKHVLENLDGCLCVGVTCMSGSPITDSLAMAAAVRSQRPDIPLVWGGFHPTLVPGTTLSNPLVDILVMGQGEETMRELARALETGAALGGIRGIAYKKNGQSFINQPRENKDINGFPSIDYSLIPAENYLKNDAGSRTLDYLSGRGCPYNCAFCCINTVYGRKYYSYPADKVVDEIEGLVKAYNINGIRFMDDNFFVDRKRTESICRELIARKLNIKWWAMCRIDEIVKFDDGFWRLLKNAGLTLLNVGVESGSQKVLDRISKQITPELTLEAAQRLKQYSVRAQFSFMAGFPFETEEDLSATMKLMDKIAGVNPSVDMGLFIYTPNPGTPLYNESLKQGFHEYSSLEQWGVKADYFTGSSPWLNVKARNKLEIVSFLSQFVFGRTLRRKFKLLPKLIHKLFSIDAKLRWKYRLLSFPLEWKLIRFLSGGSF